MPHAVLFAAVCWLMLVSFFLSMSGYFGREPEEPSSSIGSSIFFACVSVYAVFAGAWILRRSAQLVLEMPLTCDRVRKENYAKAMTLVDARMLLSLLLLGIVGGAAHNMLILGSPNLFLIWKSSADVGISIGVWLVWLTMSSVVGSFVSNAYRFAEIGAEYLEVDLLEPEGMQLIGRAALMPTLGLIGTQSFYPLLWIGGEAGLLEAFPGFFITTVWVAFLFYRSAVPTHRRIKAAKYIELKQISMGISKARITSTDRLSQELNSLLSYRTHIEKCSDWPFRIGIIFRWVFYILIPPLTWVGAALIENIVDAVLA